MAKKNYTKKYTKKSYTKPGNMENKVKEIVKKELDKNIENKFLFWTSGASYVNIGYDAPDIVRYTQMVKGTSRLQRIGNVVQLKRLTVDAEFFLDSGTAIARVMVLRSLQPELTFVLGDLVWYATDIRAGLSPPNYSEKPAKYQILADFKIPIDANEKRIRTIRKTFDLSKYKCRWDDSDNTAGGHIYTVAWSNTTTGINPPSYIIQGYLSYEDA